MAAEFGGVRELFDFVGLVEVKDGGGRLAAFGRVGGWVVGDRVGVVADRVVERG